MWLLGELNDVSAFAGGRRRVGFPFSERVSGGNRQHGAGDGGQNVGINGEVCVYVSPKNPMFLLMV